MSYFLSRILTHSLSYTQPPTPTRTLARTLTHTLSLSSSDSCGLLMNGWFLSSEDHLCCHKNETTGLCFRFIGWPQKKICFWVLNTFIEYQIYIGSVAQSVERLSKVPDQSNWWTWVRTPSAACGGRVRNCRQKILILSVPSVQIALLSA